MRPLLLLAFLCVFPLAVNAISANPCSLCKYATFCVHCDEKCPCAEDNTHPACRYCSYCPLCQISSICSGCEYMSDVATKAVVTVATMAGIELPKDGADLAQEVDADLKRWAPKFQAANVERVANAPIPSSSAPKEDGDADAEKSEL